MHLFPKRKQEKRESTFLTDFVKFQRRVQARARLRVARGRGRPGPGLGGAPAEGGGAEGGADELRRPRGTGLLFAFLGKSAAPYSKSPQCSPTSVLHSLSLTYAST